MNVVISGSADGIGCAIAGRFLREGYEVYGFDVRESGITHPRYRHILQDIREEVRETVPDPHILINNAGTLEEEEAVEINLNGTMRFSEHFQDSPCLRSVLFIASASARNGSEFPRYSASKAGVVGYMKNRALYFAKRGICCNSISPGGVITEANRHILESPALYKAVLAETLLGKWADPSEIADLAYYLTVVNRSVTGEDILIDNGEMLRSNFIW